MKRTNIEIDMDQIIDLVMTAQDGLINYIKRAELSDDGFMLLFESFKQLNKAQELMFRSKIAS